MTFSIIGRCAETGQIGIAVASSFMAVTARCAFVRAGVGAVAIQSMADPRLGPSALDLMAGGYRPEAVIRAFERGEEGFDYRQVALINARGETAVHCGRNAAGICAAAEGEGCAALGNRLADPAIPKLLARVWATTSGELADRLLAALQAGAAESGKVGPIHAAGLEIAEQQSWPLVDLRVDWTDGDPVAELVGLWRLWRPQMRDYLTRALDPAATPEALQRD
jgi:uncharacterized Ntn-hydrolase superfamily protein